MFFKSISLGVITLFLGVAYMNIGASKDDKMESSKTSLLFKKEYEQVSLKQEEPTTIIGKCESYIITDFGKKCLSSNVHNISTGDKKEIEDNLALYNKANAEDATNLQNSLSNPSNNNLIPVQSIGMVTTQQKEVFTERDSSVLVSPFAKEAL